MVTAPPAQQHLAAHPLRGLHGGSGAWRAAHHMVQVLQVLGGDRLVVVAVLGGEEDLSQGEPLPAGKSLPTGSGAGRRARVPTLHGSGSLTLPCFTCNAEALLPEKLHGNPQHRRYAEGAAWIPPPAHTPTWCPSSGPNRGWHRGWQTLAMGWLPTSVNKAFLGFIHSHTRYTCLWRLCSAEQSQETVWPAKPELLIARPTESLLTLAWCKVEIGLQSQKDRSASKAVI